MLTTFPSAAMAYTVSEENYDAAVEQLAMVAYQEAGGEGQWNQMAVCQVVLNRVDSPYYPNTIYEVLRQPYQFGRLCWDYSWASRSQWAGEAPYVAQCYDSARRVLAGEQVVPSTYMHTDGVTHY